MEANRYTGFPHIFVAIRIYLTIPVAVASGETSFSKLRRLSPAKLFLKSVIVLIVIGEKYHTYHQNVKKSRVGGATFLVPAL